MYVLLYLEFYAPTFTSAEILRAAELFPSSSEGNSNVVSCRDAEGKLNSSKWWRDGREAREGWQNCGKTDKTVGGLGVQAAAAGPWPQVSTRALFGREKP